MCEKNKAEQSAAKEGKVTTHDGVDISDKEKTDQRTSNCCCKSVFIAAIVFIGACVLIAVGVGMRFIFACCGRNCCNGWCHDCCGNGISTVVIICGTVLLAVLLIVCCVVNCQKTALKYRMNIEQQRTSKQADYAPVSFKITRKNGSVTIEQYESERKGSKKSK